MMWLSSFRFILYNQFSLMICKVTSKNNILFFTLENEVGVSPVSLWSDAVWVDWATLVPKTENNLRSNIFFSVAIL